MDKVKLENTKDNKKNKKIKMKNNPIHFFKKTSRSEDLKNLADGEKVVSLLHRRLGHHVHA